MSVKGKDPRRNGSRRALAVLPSDSDWRTPRLAAIVGGVTAAGLIVAFSTYTLARSGRTATKPPVEVRVVSVVSVEPLKPIPVKPPVLAPGNVPAAAPVIAIAPPPREAAIEVPVVAVVAPKPVPDRPVPFAERAFDLPVPVRIDTRSADEIEKDLLGVREVSLDSPLKPRASQDVLKVNKSRIEPRVEPPVFHASVNRPDLAGLPFRMGKDAMLSRDRAEAMNSLSRVLRENIVKSIAAGEVRPDADRLFVSLVTDNQKMVMNENDRNVLKKRKWATPDAVPCISQMLQAEGTEVRRLGCELLRDMPTTAATEALVKWAVFDTHPQNRAVAVDALKARDRVEVARLLTPWLRYPWPRAVEHTCEALISLDLNEMVPQLAAAFDMPDPDAPFVVELPGTAGGIFRREMVRVNHLKNCLLCHPSSFAPGELVRGSIPDPQSPLPPPTQPSYYSQGGEFVAAEVTYLMQDFSVVQPVMNHGPWPSRQRYDYFISIRRDPAGKTYVAPEKSVYRKAIGLALRELGGRDPAADRDWVRQQKSLAFPFADTRVADAARFVVLHSKPAAYTSLRTHDFSVPPERMSPAELGQVAGNLDKLYGPAARLALLAHFEPIARGTDPELAAKAQRVIDTIHNLDGWIGLSLKQSLEND